MLYSKRQATMFVIMCSVILNRLLYCRLESKDEEDIDEKLNNIFQQLYLEVL